MRVVTERILIFLGCVIGQGSGSGGWVLGGGDGESL